MEKPFVAKAWRADAGASALFHRVEEFGVVLGRAHLVEHELERLDLVHVVEELAQDPHFLQDGGLQQQLLAARQPLTFCAVACIACTQLIKQLLLLQEEQDPIFFRLHTPLRVLPEV